MKVAILDMYDNTPNLGMKGIKQIVARYDDLNADVFDVRGKCEVPGLEYDIYIFSGGPGNPLEGDGIWDRAFFFLLDKLWKHNQRSENKKYAFFICHSFQMVCHYLSIGTITRRHEESIGVPHVNLTPEGKMDPVFSELPKPFYAADFRSWQVVNHDPARLKALGSKILAMEGEGIHAPDERAVMAVRFSPEWLGTQFHPEANPEGMLVHFSDSERKSEIIEKTNLDNYNSMVDHAKDPEKLQVTYDYILPAFLNNCIEKIKLETVANLVD